MADKTECSGSEIGKPLAPDIESCAQSCRGVSSMFIYGRNGGSCNRCYTNGCTCVCETGAMPDGTCPTTSAHCGYDLFKVEEGRSSGWYILYNTLNKIRY